MARTVLLKPGVTDPVALSVLAAARDLGMTADAVRTFRRYVLSAPGRAEVRNVFNDQTLVGFNTAVTPNFRGPVDGDGLPTEYVKGPRFGQGTSVGDYPLARQFRMSLGFRF